MAITAGELNAGAGVGRFGFRVAGGSLSSTILIA
jgi:hypothetical protein